MKLAILLTTLLTAATVIAADKVTFVSHEKMNAALAKSDTVITAPDLQVQGSFRNGTGQAELHDKETDVFYIVEGEATFVTGGKMVGAKVTAPGQTRAPDMQGGEAHHLTKGDVIVVPAGTPHWFKEVPKSVSYYVVKVLK